jgi:hypothetical protein
MCHQLPVHGASGYCAQKEISSNVAAPLVLQDHVNGQLPFLQAREPAKENHPTGQLVQLFESGPENVPAEH